MPPIATLRTLKVWEPAAHRSYFFQPIVTAGVTARLKSSSAIPGGLGIQSITLSGDTIGGNRELGLDFNPSKQEGTVPHPFFLSAPPVQVLSGTRSRGKWPPQLDAQNGAAFRFNATLPTSGAYLLAVAASVLPTRPTLYVTLGPSVGYSVQLIPPPPAPAPGPTPGPPPPAPAPAPRPTPGPPPPQPRRGVWPSPRRSVPTSRTCPPGFQWDPIMRTCWQGYAAT